MPGPSTSPRSTAAPSSTTRRSASIPSWSSTGSGGDGDGSSRNGPPRFWRCCGALSHFPLRRLAICGPGWTEPCRTPCVFVGNNEYALSADLVRHARERSIAASCGSASRRRKAGSRCSRWRSNRRSGCCARAAICGRSRPIPPRSARAASACVVAVDGEVEILETPLRYRTRPGALRVFAPAETEPPETGGRSAEPAAH